MLGLPSFVPL